MRIDTVIDSYNYGRFLAAAIDSALAQTHPHVRVIVVDDGSTDDSPQIIASYGERIVPVLKPNGGQGSAFNAGSVAADGDIVVVLDADDTLDAGIAARVAAAATAQPGVGKFQWRLELTDADGRRTEAFSRPRALRCPRAT